MSRRGDKRGASSPLAPLGHHAGCLGPHSASLARGSLVPEKQRPAAVWPRDAHLPCTSWLQGRYKNMCFTLTGDSQAQKRLRVWGYATYQKGVAWV